MFLVILLNKTQTCVYLFYFQEEEEEDDVVMEDNLVVTTMGSKNGIVITSRGTKVQAKKRGTENFSPGRPGKHH